jgi:integrase
LGDRIVSTIKPTDITRYQTTRKGQGIAKTTIDGELTHIKTVVTKAFDDDLVGGRTLKAFKKWKKLAKPEQRTRDRTLTLDEYLALVTGCPVDHLRNVLVIAMHTGMRPGEIKGLLWDHVDLEGGFIRLPAAIVKEDRDKVVPINHHVDALLRSLPSRFVGGPVLTYAGRSIGKHRASLKTACQKVGILYGKNVKNGFILHDLRRTFKTNMVTAGVDGVYRDTIVGHSLGGMDKHYIKPTEEDLTRAMAKYTDWFDNEIAGVDHSVDHENSTS